MGNLDFTNQVGFSWYCVLLVVSGALMTALSVLPGQSRGGRIANLVFGIGFCCYGFYLIFLFSGGTYFIFFKAFILPVILIANTFKSIAAKRNAKAAGQQNNQMPYAQQNYQMPQGQYAQPPYAQPQYVQPQPQFAPQFAPQDQVAAPAQPTDGMPSAQSM